MTDILLYNNMRAANKSYNDHIYAIYLKYGGPHSDDQMTVEEAKERVVLNEENRKQRELFRDSGE